MIGENAANYAEATTAWEYKSFMHVSFVATQSNISTPIFMRLATLGAVLVFAMN